MQKNLYVHRINAVIGHVREHLNEDLSLDGLAKVANFSPFHFHRLFKSITGETINELVTRSGPRTRREPASFHPQLFHHRRCLCLRV